MAARVLRYRFKSQVDAGLLEEFVSECASASVRFMYLRPCTLSMVSRVITFSSRAASATVGLMVEQGM